LRVVGIGGSPALARIGDGRLKTMAYSTRPDMRSIVAAEWSKRFMLPVGTSWWWQRCWRLAGGGGLHGGGHAGGGDPVVEVYIDVDDIC
jgi:hypothetical protein